VLIFADPADRNTHHGAAIATRPQPAPLPAPTPRTQALTVAVALMLVFSALGTQLVRLGQRADIMISASMAEPVATSHSRPDIVDRSGRLLATDVEVHSLYADPARVLDRDELVEQLSTVLPDFDAEDVRRALADRQRRFLWLRRGLSPRLAQAVNDLGLPGLGFKKELRRAYPLGSLAGHILGHVNASNLGVFGIERHIDETAAPEPAHSARTTERPPVRLSIDVAAQGALESELADTSSRLNAAGAAAIVMDANSGEIVAAASLPRADPSKFGDVDRPDRRDRLQNGAFELGSIFKAFTIAMSLDMGRVTPASVIDVRQPITSGRYEFKDKIDRPLTVSEVFVLSSNIGTAQLALDAGTSEQKLFLARAGLLSPMRTEAGPITPPDVPSNWERTETITISYGHGLSVAPMQFTAAAAALVNGGLSVKPTFLKRGPSAAPLERTRIISPETSAAIRAMMRANVTEGTGRRAEVPGYDIGGKTGTAEIPGPRGYRNGAVISSFFAAFPISAPRYVALVMVFEPKPSAETGGKVLAGVTAAPAAGRILARLGPLLER
jgi:cell division protein FtsI (penicillin-binding protein 3)